MQKNDVVVVMIRKRPKVARYVGPAPAGAEHLVNLGDDTKTDLRLVEVGDIITLSRQPEPAA